MDGMRNRAGAGERRRGRFAAAGLLGAVVALVLALPGACSDECSRNSDCGLGEYCFRGECRSYPAADADADADADGADGDADVPPDGDEDGEGTTGEDGGDGDADGDEDAAEAVDDGGRPDTLVCGCLAGADCQPSDIPCTFFQCDPATDCCDDLHDVPGYCAAAPGPTYCGGADWCLGGTLMAGSGASRCTDADPPEVDNCDVDAGSCVLTATLRVCPW